jgi:hypothetical protein
MTLIEKIKEICDEHIENTEIDNVILCEDPHDHYLLGKKDLAFEILEKITINETVPHIDIEEANK